MQHLSKNVQHEYGAFRGIEDPVDAVEDDDDDDDNPFEWSTCVAKKQFFMGFSIS